VVGRASDQPRAAKRLPPSPKIHPLPTESTRQLPIHPSPPSSLRPPHLARCTLLLDSSAVQPFRPQGNTRPQSLTLPPPALLFRAHPCPSVAPFPPFFARNLFSQIPSKIPSSIVDTALAFPPNDFIAGIWSGPVYGQPHLCDERFVAITGTSLQNWFTFESHRAQRCGYEANRCTRP
jgi:hypothetical protein